MPPISTRAAVSMPMASPGMRVGLFGGSFNPAHAAHRAASLLALRRLQLDRIWWLVTPGNPLKDNWDLPSIEERVAFARRIAHHPLIDVTGVEATLGTSYSYETISTLVERLPRVRFVWIMGADNLAHFARWQRWRDIASLVPVAVVDRLGDSLCATSSRAAQALAPYRVPEQQASALADMAPPAWTFLHGLKSPISSTEIRAARRKLEPASAQPEFTIP
ncbi:putative nicotinate-nucleotide adenylyltransferase [Azorhizobium oxalatiphilum]|uniref:Probable nicotinate-nucleotide adenylyltransferase n=2 Tax=Azorhizobium oxalatiphilum TaxID=980631 RepID=A0A917BLC7_9HYPH|nr:putative nicotinate-nucleotide adenylyltransferase [Azorhizobium oxalatiphilum]